MRASEHAVELLRTAMQIERDGYAFYCAAAAETKDSNAVKMFLSLARDEMEHQGKLETDQFVLMGRKVGQNAFHCLNGIHGVEGREDQVPGLCGPDGGLNCLQVTKLTDQNNIWVLTQDSSQRLAKTWHVNSNGALIDDRFFVVVIVLNWVLDGHDMAVQALIDVINHTG